MLSFVKFPANAMRFNSILLEFATFDLFPTESLENDIYYRPEEEPYTSNFEQSGYEGRLLISNTGSQIWIIYIHLTLALMSNFYIMCSKSCHKSCTKKFYWNGLIRLFMEIYADVALLAALNLKVIGWESPLPSVTYSNWYSLISGVFILSLPLAFLIFYSCKWR